MTPIYRFLKTAPFRRLHSVVDRLEKELLGLEAHGIIVEQVPPAVTVTGRRDRHEVVTLSGGGTMRNGLGFIYVHQLEIRRDGSGARFVVDEFRSYASFVVGDDVVVRYDSGHRTHKQQPHLESPWCDTHQVAPPVICDDREIELSAFLRAADEWRESNRWRLATDSPALDSIRLP